jgi:hypothetical protein
MMADVLFALLCNYGREICLIEMGTKGKACPYLPDCSRITHHPEFIRPCKRPEAERKPEFPIMIAIPSAPTQLTDLLVL